MSPLAFPVVRLLLRIVIVYPYIAVIFFFKNIHDIMMFGFFSFLGVMLYILADLASRIP